jgi:hypothetical protein
MVLTFLVPIQSKNFQTAGSKVRKRSWFTRMAKPLSLDQRAHGNVVMVGVILVLHRRPNLELSFEFGGQVLATQLNSINSM